MLRVLLGVGIAVAAAWVALSVTLAVARPDGATLRDAMRVLPDTIVLVRRLAADPQLPPSVRRTLWLLGGYLVLPIDVVPDFIPLLGYADDAIVVAMALRRSCGQPGSMPSRVTGPVRPLVSPLSVASPASHDAGDPVALSPGTALIGERRRDESVLPSTRRRGQPQSTIRSRHDRARMQRRAVVRSRLLAHVFSAFAAGGDPGAGLQARNPDPRQGGGRDC